MSGNGSLGVSALLKSSLIHNRVVGLRNRDRDAAIGIGWQWQARRNDMITADPKCLRVDETGWVRVRLTCYHRNLNSAEVQTSVIEHSFGHLHM
jgi:hypothetical protein